jgi:hypothetical protein
MYLPWTSRCCGNGDNARSEKEKNVEGGEIVPNYKNFYVSTLYSLREFAVLIGATGHSARAPE